MNSDREELLNDHAATLDHHPECEYSPIASLFLDIMLNCKLPGHKAFVHCGGDCDLRVRRNLAAVWRDSDASSAARIAVS